MARVGITQEQVWEAGAGASPRKGSFTTTT